ncbi:hypothetical protein [Alkalicoccus saliphilus]|uniref:Uncharacterized protein n=1 Tax=Alkalicoccus saliphilus TaxID=200989 RepID=A0A2T4U6D2_9BACI|nr:hypothetical protein [Alkalicoccus saliphilus]PTL38925.1 hypothetical protein C6Y45_09050 [Alkalicoccus saliphilus]
MPMQIPAFASSGRFPGGPASANFFLPLLGRNGSSARPISPRSRLLQLQQENKKKVLLLKNVLIPPFLPFRRGFFLRNDRRGRRWDKAKSEDPFPWPKGWKIADDEPHGKLPPGSVGESYTLRRIIILKPRLNQHAEKATGLMPVAFCSSLPLQELQNY